MTAPEPQPEQRPATTPPNWSMPGQAGPPQPEPTQYQLPPAPNQGQYPGGLPYGQPEPTEWPTGAQSSSTLPYWPPQQGAPGAVSGPVPPANYSYGVPGQIPSLGGPLDAAPKPKRKARTWLLVGIPVLILVLVAAGLVALHIVNEVNPAVNKVVCNPKSLTSCLVAPPAKAGSNTSSWATATTVTSTAYAAAYPNSGESQQPEISSLVTNDGLKAIVHRSWYQGPEQIDIILLSFDTAQGAQAWASDRTGEFLADDSGPQLTVPGDSTAKAYSTSTTDGSGDIDVRYVTTVGDIDFEAHYASQGTLQQQDFNLWAGTEYASLQSAPAPGPAPSPTPTAFQAATCPGTLTKCLMPFPSGGQTVPGIPSTYTITSFTNDFITKADETATAQRMQTDNVTGIDSESWGTNGFDEAGQVILIQTRTDSQAQDLGSYIGGDAGYTDTFTIPGYSQASGSYTTTADSDGFYEGLVTEQTGTVFMSLWLDFTGSFSTSTAQTWAVSELNLLAQDTQSHWGFPIPQVTAPTLPAFAPGTCPASTLASCVMAVPSGSTANTPNGGSTVQADLGVSGLVADLYTSRQNYEQAWLTSDGAKGAATESWTAANGATGTDYVTQFGSSRQAQAAALQLIGDSTAGAQSCTVPGLPNTTCLVLPEDDSTGAVPIRVTAWSGDYMIDLELTQTDSADTTDALTWAQSQLELLAGS